MPQDCPARTTCRVCGSTSLTPLFSLGEQYVSNFVDREHIYDGPKAPIDLDMCRQCTLVQLRHTAPQEFMYTRHYWYRSGVTHTMQAALQDVALAAMQTVHLEPTDPVLDIGSNDGTLLRCFANNQLTIGVEPANNMVEDGSKGITHFVHDFWNAEAYWDVCANPAKVITACGMFYDLEDPNQFIEDISRVLDPKGVFIAQIMCAKNMLDIGDVGNFAHEHLEFYSLMSLQYLFAKHGLEIFDIETNSVNGRSYRLYVRKVGSNVSREGGLDRVHAACAAEEDAGMLGIDVYMDFFRRMEANKKACVDFIKDANRTGKTVWVYGASTKGNCILQYYGLDTQHIDGAADRSPEKWGKYTVGTGIPIHSEEYARAVNPNYFLVLPYAFLDEFVAREELWLNKGGKFLVPLPTFRIV